MSRNLIDHDPSRVPDGRQIRRVTAQVQGAREGNGIGAVLLEVWNAVVIIVLSGLFVAGFAAQLQVGATPDVVADLGLVTGPVSAALLVLVATGGLLSLAARLGPVGVGGGGAAWWLPMPVDRRGLLRGTVIAWPLAAAAAGLVAGATAVMLTDAPQRAAVLVWWGVTGAALLAVAAAVALLAQPRGRGAGSRAAARTGEVTMLSAVLALGAIAVGGGGGWASSVPWPGAVLLLVAVPCLAAAVIGTVRAERAAGELDGGALRLQGSVGYRAQAALLSLDLRELGRALTTASLRTERPRSASLRARGPRRALVLADLLLAARTPRTLGQVLAAVGLGAAAGTLALLHEAVPLYLAWVVTGFWATSAAAAGARHADLVPAVDRLLPISARAAKVTRAVTPLLAATLWGATVLGVHALRTEDPRWMLLGLAWAPVLAVGAVRAAYRPPARWSRVVVATPMGAVPPTGGVFHGLDVALVGTLPGAVALLLGSVPDVLLLTQAGMTVAVVAAAIAISGQREGARV